MQHITTAYRVGSCFFKCLAILMFLSAHGLQLGMQSAHAMVGRPSLHVEGKLVLAFGDSLTAGYGLASGQSVPARLEAALNASGTRVTVHNAGVSGDTTAAGLARLNWVLASLPRKPDLVILELGANDALRGIDPKITRLNLEAMLGELGKRSVPVLLAGMKAPPNMGKDYAVPFNAIFPDLAKRHKIKFYPFYLNGIVANASLNQADGMHPTVAGVAIIVKNLLPVVQQALQGK